MNNELKKRFLKEQPKINKIFCDNCNEQVVFTLKIDNELVNIPLSKILECLFIAEEEGQVPEIDSDFWAYLSHLYTNIKSLYNLRRIRQEQME